MSFNKCWVLDNKGVFPNTDTGEAQAKEIFRTSLQEDFPKSETRIIVEINEVNETIGYLGQVLNTFDEVWYTKSRLYLLKNLESVISEVSKYVYS